MCCDFDGVRSHAMNTLNRRAFLGRGTAAAGLIAGVGRVWGAGAKSESGGQVVPTNSGKIRGAKQDVVVVTVNHRLNVFGYLYLADLGGEKYARSSNVGMLDTVAALEWVRDNIAAFGGDPGNVTIFGQSGGGGKVSTLMGVPAA